MQTVKSIMSKEIEKVNIDDSVKDVAKTMATKKIGSVLVEHNGNLIGIITETDIVRKVVGQDMSLQDTIASKIMNSPILTVDAEASILDANDTMDKHNIRHLAVSEEGAIVGVISVRDLIHPMNLNEEPY
ncbi:MAG TPA: CBS domain-containing protein [Nitrospinota bacterium]|jgi:CBS domain-containing protein|nr:CBS domain-containing protein [Nitrospinota bacterium]|tara:strand:- start:341 stop:730 length:390 start_codon:yes stop_codon:yes gene_type:complete